MGGLDRPKAGEPAVRQSYFRIHPAGCDPVSLLDPDHQESEPWGHTPSGPCEKCEGSGHTTYECRSCKARSDRLVELEGSVSGRPDFDADEGALLFHPTRIVAVRPPDSRRIVAISRERRR
jgi:hypothetical protein